MFTGLVESKGSLVRRTQLGSHDARLVVRGELVSCERDPIVLGESIAIDGVCLTVDKIVEAGGRRLIRIVDDGRGMTPEDLELAVERHEGGVRRLHGRGRQDGKSSKPQERHGGSSDG